MITEQQIESLGWASNAIGELDHSLVKAPYIRLALYKKGSCGDVIYTYDLRITQPNVNYLSAVELHSFEHLLLLGFRKYIPDHFINVAPMGCQTGFYLLTLNEGRAEIICSAYQQILNDIVKSSEVPYANINSCGQYVFHNLNLAKKLAESLLASSKDLMEVL